MVGVSFKNSGGSGRIRTHYFLLSLLLLCSMIAPLSNSNCIFQPKKSIEATPGTDCLAPIAAVALSTAEAGPKVGKEDKENGSLVSSQGGRQSFSPSTHVFVKPPRRDEMESAMCVYTDGRIGSEKGSTSCVVQRDSVPSYQALMDNAKRVLSVSVTGDLYCLGDECRCIHRPFARAVKILPDHLYLNGRLEVVARRVRHKRVRECTLHLYSL